MVVKILSSAMSFSGIEYNESKVSIGTAKLMAAENLGLLETNESAGVRGVQEYQQFFKAWSLNERGGITNPQFHVAISCKGREYNAEELKDIAEQYLEKMGYKSNPYLIYFHSDTENNHVHIVSSRINQFGFKINDSFERRRSQSAMSEILGLSAAPQVSEQVKKAMTYNFSSEAQFKMMLERDGVTLRPKDNRYQFIRDGRVSYEINKNLIENKIITYQEPIPRIRQLKALFVKYKPALSPDNFAEFMQIKFGVDVVFHTAKGKVTPYGYTIIDHSSGQVLKGGQVMKLSELLTIAPRAEKLKSGADLIANLAEDDRLRFRDFKAQLSQLGFELNKDGAVRFAGEQQVSFNISKERMKQVVYNDRLYEAQKFKVNTPSEADIIRKVMYLKKEHAPQPNHQVPGAEQARIILSDKLNSLLAIGKDLDDIAKENGYTYAKNAGEVFLIDQKNHAIFRMADLTTNKLDYTGAQVIDLDQLGMGLLRDIIEYNTGNFWEITNQLLTTLAAGFNDDEDQEQKLRRKRKINNT